VSLEAIERRYSALASQGCCLSCGRAASLADPRPGEACLDLGSGRGTDALRLAEAVGPSGRVTGLDAAEGMLRKARELAERLGVTNIEFVRAELEHLPVPDASVDLVISNCTVNHAADKQAVWREVARVLRPGGRFVVSDILASAPVPAEYVRDPVAVAECWAGAVTEAAYLEQLDRAGFGAVEILEKSAPYPKGAIEVLSWTIRGVKPGLPPARKEDDA
jgi:ubiquinone/menaquinone biosynthesis C-methylase UbiE